jgi:hypothetical protein
VNHGLNKIWVGQIAVLRQLLLARKTFLLTKAPAELLTLQFRAAEAEFMVVEALLRNQTTELKELSGEFIGCYRSLTQQIPPENVLAFSGNGEALLNQLQAALKQAHLTAA